VKAEIDSHGADPLRIQEMLFGGEKGDTLGKQSPNEEQE